MPKKSPPLVKSTGDWHYYMPIADRPLHSGCFVTSVGSSMVRPGEAYPKARHPTLYHFTWEEGRTLPDFSLMLIESGSGCFESRETGLINIPARSVVLLFPGVWHRYQPNKSTGWTEKWVQFNGEFAHQLIEQRVLSPQKPVIHLSNPRAVEKAIDHLHHIVLRSPESNSYLISLLSLGILAAAIQSGPLPSFAPIQQDDGASKLAAAAVDCIWTLSHNVLSVADVANTLGVSRRTLERHVMSSLGHTVLDEIIRCRFNRAERLLRETTVPIKTIVNLAGFGSMENMRQAFLSRTGLPPAAYRSARVQNS